MRRRRRFASEPEDDGYVGYHQGKATIGFVEWNSREHLRGFDELHPRLREAINYATSPEEGALPVAVLIGMDETGKPGPWADAARYGDVFWQMMDEEISKIRGKV